MTKREFLDKLKSALANDLSGPVIQDNVNYYNDYINGEVKKGRGEAEVIRELGDPWAIAKNIITLEEIKGNKQETYESYEPKRQSYEEDNRKSSVHLFGIDTWWKKVLLILGMIGIVLAVVAVVSGLISFLMPLLPVIIVCWIMIRFFRGRRW